VPSSHTLVRRPLLPFLIAVAAITTATLFLSAGPADAAAFDDTAGRSYDDAVQALVDEGVLNGCLVDRFCPMDDLTRAQMASILVRALDLPATDRQYFSDVRGVHTANINALAEAGITQGCAEAAFCPHQTVTREQAASLIAAAFELPAASEPHFDDTSSTHADGINRVAEAGITAGCGTSLTSFCGRDPVLRWHTAVFVARAMGLEPTVELTPLATRREQQAVLDEQERQRLAEEEARRQAETEAAAATARDAMWDDLAQCESGGNWSINTGNGYYGGLQFSLSSWQWVGGSGYPHHHTREQQIYRAEILLSRQGWNAWPSCSRQLGYR
jgi:hypothetical protein